MATTHPTDTADRTTRDARVHQLADDGLSHRAIARQVGIHHTTVSRILRTTPAPARTTPQETERTTPTPAAPAERTVTLTSGVRRAPRLLHDLDPRTIQDLNCLMDSTTGDLPEPIQRYLRAAADARRATMRTTMHRIAADEPTAETGRTPVRAQVAP
ncbi:helix-turn-helix domain-containing protein [Streptomyces olivaceus]|uniref:helix-turn-helix domain-containing protein n=1 Tax=Streptomyces olivaceus TaxID=47716 RepID=UPI001CCC3DFD|nr:helix-turn-helix domain-containing protein [Streptomyces olivaceus]MBZ6258143.1 helix-turn-helix domain-containing protein [Streptomyces olivaceus]